jgi:hypothetical protein
VYLDDLLKSGFLIISFSLLTVVDCHGVLPSLYVYKIGRLRKLSRKQPFVLPKVFDSKRSRHDYQSQWTVLKLHMLPFFDTVLVLLPFRQSKLTSSMGDSRQ